MYIENFKYTKNAFIKDANKPCAQGPFIQLERQYLGWLNV